MPPALRPMFYFYKHLPHGLVLIQDKSMIGPNAIGIMNMCYVKAYKMSPL